MNPAINQIFERVKSRTGCLFHFTPRENLPSITRFGLLPLEVSRKWNLSPTFASDENSRISDHRLSVDRYVHLCFVDDHPMCRKKLSQKTLASPLWVRVSPRVLLWEGVRFSEGATNSENFPLLTAEQALEKILWEKLYLPSSGGLSDDEFNARRDARMAEVLIPKPIELAYLKFSK
jgi:hypothetical protein